MKYLGHNFQQSLIFYAFLIFKVLEFKQIWPKMKDSFMIIEIGQKLTSREKSFKASTHIQIILPIVKHLDLLQYQSFEIVCCLACCLRNYHRDIVYSGKRISL